MPTPYIPTPGVVQLVQYFSTGTANAANVWHVAKADGIWTDAAIDEVLDVFTDWEGLQGHRSCVHRLPGNGPNLPGRYYQVPVCQYRRYGRSAGLPPEHNHCGQAQHWLAWSWHKWSSLLVRAH